MSSRAVPAHYMHHSGPPPHVRCQAFSLETDIEQKHEPGEPIFEY